MTRLRSVGARLSLALLVVVAGALAIIYLALVPTLERNLVDARLAQLARSADALRDGVPGNRDQWQIFVENSAPTVNARVALVQPLLAGPQPLVLPIADSRPIGSGDLQNDPIAVRAAIATRDEPQTGVLEIGDASYAEAAVRVFPDVVVVARAPLR